MECQILLYIPITQFAGPLVMVEFLCSKIASESIKDFTRENARDYSRSTYTEWGNDINLQINYDRA